MNGWDFSILWEAGWAAFHGQDPYSVPYFYYPLPFAYLLGLFSVFPKEVSFWLWIGINLSLLIYFFRRQFWQWVLFVPILHLFSSGQFELFWWAMERVMRPNIWGAFLGAMITLKPQTALLLLPWHLYDWIRNDRKTLFHWSVFTALIWGAPLLWRPGWIKDWLAAVPSNLALSASNTTGIFSFLRLAPWLWPFLSLSAIVIFFWGSGQNRAVARASALLAAPVGLFYSNLTLLGCAPAWLLTPLSLLAAGLSLLFQSFIPFIILPVTVIYWQRLQSAGTRLGYEADALV